MINSTTEHEKQSLEAHVDLCAIRYQSLDQRLSGVERKITDLHTDIKSGNQTNIRALISAVVTIVVAVIGAVATILSSIG